MIIKNWNMDILSVSLLSLLCQFCLCCCCYQLLVRFCATIKLILKWYPQLKLGLMRVFFSLSFCNGKRYRVSQVMLNLFFVWRRYGRSHILDNTSDPTRKRLSMLTTIGNLVGIYLPISSSSWKCSWRDGCLAG